MNPKKLFICIQCQKYNKRKNNLIKKCRCGQQNDSSAAVVSGRTLQSHEKTDSCDFINKELSTPEDWSRINPPNGPSTEAATCPFINIEESNSEDFGGSSGCSVFPEEEEDVLARKVHQISADEKVICFELTHTISAV